MQVYVLHFDSRGSLTRAFDLILAAPDVDSCMIESERNRIRLLAPVEAAEKITERIYRDRGLIWCSRHALNDSAASET